MNQHTDIDEQLREACCTGNTEVVCKLIKTGVNVNSQNKMNGWTCLHWAAKRGHSSIISILLCNHANISVKNFKGETAIDVAANENIRRVLQNNSSILPNASKIKNIVKTEEISEHDIEAKNVNALQTGNSQTHFVPNYLLNPVFPHLQKQSDNYEKQNKSDYLLNQYKLLQCEYAKNHKLNHNITSSDDDELVLKIRKANSDELDFIEVELSHTQLTFDNLLHICCTELEMDKSDVVKIRKLPNTIVRKDKDVKRLVQFQEIEILSHTVNRDNSL